MTPTIGIDLGTTNTCAAAVDKGRARILVSELGYSTLPSVVTFDDKGDAVVGQRAERRLILEPEHTVYGSKRMLGRAALSGAVAKFQPHFAYMLVKDDGWIAANVCGRIVTFTEVASLILREVKSAAEKTLGGPVGRAVVTVPAYFNDAQRACVREAGRMAELDVIRILNEPTAAALAFGAQQHDPQTVLVFDLGGGTFDVSIVKLEKDRYEVLGVGGDTFLGGIDFDLAFMEAVIESWQATHDTLLTLTLASHERMRLAIQAAKHELSQQSKYLLSVPHLQLGDDQTIDFSMTVDRAMLETATRPLVDRTITATKNALDAAQLAPGDMDDVLLVGGQTRMPLLHELVRDLFGKEPSKRVHPDEVVAIGAALAADSLEHSDKPVLVDVLPMAIGLTRDDGTMQVVILKNTPVPYRTNRPFTVPAGTTAHPIAIYQGNHDKVVDNEYLGSVVVDRLPANHEALAGTLWFELDKECLLKVIAEIPALDIERHVKLTAQNVDDVVAGGQVEHVPVVDFKPAVKRADAGGTSAQAVKLGLLARVLRLFGIGRPRAGR